MLPSSSPSDRTAATPAPGAASSPNRLSELLLWLAIALLTFNLPKPPALELDASWRMAITYFFQHGFAFGRDAIFTYGPLGFLLGRTYTGDLLWAHLAWQALQAIVAATLFLRLARPLQGVARFCFLVFVLLFGIGYEDALQTMFIVLLGWSMVQKLAAPETKARVVLPGLFLGFLSVIKFTNLMLATFVIGVVFVFALLRRRQEAWWLLVAYAGSFVFLWSICGQPIRAFPQYVLNSLDISAGYQATMGLPTPSAPLWKAIAVWLLLAGYVVWHLRTQADRLRSAACFGILAAFLYLNWKHGFVRADGHMLGFFYSTLLVCLAFPALFGEQGGQRWIARCLLVPAAVLSILGVRDALPPVVDWAGSVTNEKVVKNVRALFNWKGTKQDLDNQISQQRNNADLPKTRKTIGNATVDVLGFEQAVALFNRFNYTPRPVFQSYSAYTAHLGKLNAEFYTSAKAPEYALFKLQTIDERPLLLDDSQLLLLFPHYYRFVLSEKNFQLWRRRTDLPKPEALAPKQLKQLSLPVGLPRALGEYENKSLWAEFDLQPSLIGRLRSLFYKPPTVELRVVDNENKTEVYRLPLMAAHAGFQLNPLVTDLESYLESQGGKPKRWVHSVELHLEPGDARYYAAAGTVTLFSVTPSDAKPEYDAQLERAKFGTFSIMPDETSSFTKPSEIEIDGHSALVMHAPSLMVFTPPNGATKATGWFGYPPGAYVGDGNTDGAEFRVIWATNSEKRTLFSQLIRPKQEPKDHGMHHFEVDLRGLPAGGRLLLEISPGPANEHSWDWTAWADVVIQ
jgi:hypothetical protein